MKFTTNIDNKIECPRCGGSGETEHTHVVYGICFMCKGDGMVYAARVNELTERAATRKANKEAKKALDALAEEERLDAYYTWQYSKNLDYFNSYVNRSSKGLDTFMRQVDKITELVLNANSSEADVREMLLDYFKNESFYFNYEISKWTLANYGFIFMEIYSDIDLATGEFLFREFQNN
jgi:molybdopterin converting factor small subunit